MHKPPRRNQHKHAPHNRARIVHIRRLHRHHKREAKEHDHDKNIDQRGHVHGHAPPAEVERARHDCGPAREHVWEYRARIGERREDDIRADEGGEGGGRAGVDEAETGGDAGDGDGGAERGPEARGDDAEEGAEGGGVVAGEGPEGAAAGDEGADEGGEGCEEEDGGEAEGAVGGACGLSVDLGGGEFGGRGEDGVDVGDAVEERNQVHERTGIIVRVLL